MDQCTENFECIVINNNAKSNKLEDQVFWYKANSHSDFKIGAPAFWEFHTNNYNPNYDECNSINNFSKKNKIKINVKKKFY